MVVCVEKEDHSFTWLYMVLYLEAGDNAISCHSYMLRQSHSSENRPTVSLRLVLPQLDLDQPRACHGAAV
ncbi:hypothetical protein AAFF_G00336590 [Aldrovandia affinis]|uniref:Uncharacterized protein n=1 Tax=Aldrovandia affinis TaxID=143900 RepID=A0AAD7W012_9TELE|nr:hypothetical protein AAFF_G00336590 [Aldrovandia affinis]